MGEGAYHLAGELIEPTNEPVYGPFQVGFWNSLVMYNPWKFRVYRTDNPQQKSEWVTFYLAAAEGEGEPAWDLAMLWLQLAVLPGELGQLAVGIQRCNTVPTPDRAMAPRDPPAATSMKRIMGWAI